MKKVLLFFALTLLFTSGINAQTQEPLESFKVGEYVYFVFPLEPQRGGKGHIKEINGNRVQYQYTANRFDLWWETIDENTIMLREPAYLEYKKGLDLAREFVEPSRKFLDSIAVLMSAYNPKLRLNTKFGLMPHLSDKAAWTKIRNDLAELDQLCQSKFKGVKNLLISVDKNEVMYRFEDQCKIAADRVALEKKTLQLNFEWSQGNGLRDYTSSVREEMKSGWIKSEFQLMALDFEAWKQEFTKTQNQVSKDQGGTFTDEMMEKYRPISKEIKAWIDNQSRINVFEKPRFQDAGSQNVAKKGISQDMILKNGTLLAIGMDEAAWRAYDQKTETGRDSRFIYYKIEPGKNKYKRGKMLFKTNGYCQQRDFFVKQVRGSTAISLHLLTYEGRFVQCP